MLAVMVVIGGLIAATPAQAAPKPRSVVYAVYGDAPYGTTPSDTAEFQATPAFIGSINADPDVSLVAHVGDIHSGKQYCTEAYDRSIADLWRSYQDPLIYTPGDNEWSDCLKAKQLSSGAPAGCPSTPSQDSSSSFGRPGYIDTRRRSVSRRSSGDSESRRAFSASESSKAWRSSNGRTTAMMSLKPRTLQA
jgi:hypothetical protein